MPQLPIPTKKSKVMQMKNGKFSVPHHTTTRSQEEIGPLGIFPATAVLFVEWTLLPTILTNNGVGKSEHPESSFFDYREPFRVPQSPPEICYLHNDLVSKTRT